MTSDPHRKTLQNKTGSSKSTRSFRAASSKSKSTHRVLPSPYTQYKNKADDSVSQI